MRLPWVALTFLAIAPPVAAQAPGQPSGAPVDQAESAALALASARGKLLYAYDQAAWHGTDTLRDQHPELLPRLGGWIVTGPAEAPLLIFIDKDENAPRPVFEVQFARSRPPKASVAPADAPPLTGEPLRLAKALIAARATAGKLSFCAKSTPNSVVLPPETPDGPALVYFMTPQTSIDQLPFGGHYRIDMAADNQVRAVRPFAKTCLSQPTRDGKNAVVALTVSHLLDPVPTEIHVFNSFAARLPVYVITMSNRTLWKVEGARITLVRRG